MTSGTLPRCRYLNGDNIAPRTAAAARALIGSSVEWLENADIDRSGRGMFFPRRGVVAGVYRNLIAIDHADNFTVRINELVEMRLIGEPAPAGGASRP